MDTPDRMEKSLGTGKDGAMRTFLMITYFGPSAWIFFNAAKTLSSWVNCWASLSFNTKPSMRFNNFQQVRQRDVKPQVH